MSKEHQQPATPKLSRRVYADQDKAAALAHLQSTGSSISRASRDLGVPRGTLKDWAAGKKLGPKVAEQFGVVRDTMSAQLEDVAYQLIHSIPEKILEAPLRDIGATLAHVIDRMRLLREEPTAITESINRREILEGLIQRTMERFPGISREKVIDIIRDVKPEAIKFLS